MHATISIDSLLTPEKDAAQCAKTQDQMLVVGSMWNLHAKKLELRTQIML